MYEIIIDYPPDVQRYNVVSKIVDTWDEAIDFVISRGRANKCFIINLDILDTGD